jgi:SAM-dependent methyltransferase
MQSSARPVGRLDLGDLRRVEPLSRSFGFDRGRPIDRLYIETFLERHRADIAGRVLEVGDDRYTRQFGGERVGASDVLDLQTDNPGATIYGDLTRDGLPAGQYDCVIATQVLQFIYDLPAAVANLRHTLAPGGVLLVTLPGVSQICRFDMDRWGDYWRFTSASARRLLGNAFGRERVAVATFGNVLAASAFLYGLAVEDLTEDELLAHDPDYELLVAARAERAGGAG